MLDMAMVAQCSPSMHPAIVQAIVKTESSFNPFAIGVNRGGNRLARQPSNFGEAVQTAKRLLAQGANIDMGLGQINSANMNWLNLSVEQAFNPCSNLKALQHVYLTCYDKAGATGLGNRMQRAWSCYNTGNTQKGFRNGYVTKVTTNFNEFNRSLGKPTQAPIPMQQPTQQPVYAVQNGSIVAVNPSPAVPPIQAQQIPLSVQNAPVSVAVHSNNQPPISESIQADDMPVKVYNSWDIFRDF